MKMDRHGHGMRSRWFLAGLLMVAATLPVGAASLGQESSASSSHLGDCTLDGIGNLSGPVTFAVHEFRGQAYDGGLVHLSRQEGAGWASFAGEVTGDPSWQVSEMTTFQDKLVIGGKGIDTVGGQTVNNIMTWDGTTIAPLGAGFNDEVTALVAWGDRLVAGGTFTTTGDGALTVNRIALWDGTAWQALDGGLSGTGGQGPVVRVGGLAVFQGDLWATGLFQFAGGELVNGLARWDGSAWHSAGGLTSGPSRNPGQGTAMTKHQGQLVVSGFFDRVAGFEAISMASWDGSTWHDIGQNPDTDEGPFRGADGLISAGDHLIAAGFEMFFVGNFFLDMAYWDGQTWTGGAHIGPDGIWDLAASTASPGLVYVGGSFIEITGPVPNVFTLSCPDLGFSIFADDFETGDLSGWAMTFP